MAKSYVLQKGDTLAQVAEQMLGDPKLGYWFSIIFT